MFVELIGGAAVGDEVGHDGERVEDGELADRVGVGVEAYSNTMASWCDELRTESHSACLGIR
jgi:hypothetical protein